MIGDSCKKFVSIATDLSCKCAAIMFKHKKKRIVSMLRMPLFASCYFFLQTGVSELKSITEIRNEAIYCK